MKFLNDVFCLIFRIHFQIQKGSQVINFHQLAESMLAILFILEYCLKVKLNFCESYEIAIISLHIFLVAFNSILRS